GPETHRNAAVPRSFDLSAQRAVSDEHEPDAVSVHPSRRFNHGWPGPVKPEVACMKHHEPKSAANFLRDRMLLGRAVLGDRLENPRSITYHDDAFGMDALGDDALSGVFTQHNDARRLPERPAMEPLPHSYPASRTHNLPGKRHLRIQVANIVHKRPPLQSRHEGRGDTRHRRVGHGEDEVG